MNVRDVSVRVSCQRVALPLSFLPNVIFRARRFEVFKIREIALGEKRILAKINRSALDTLFFSGSHGIPIKKLGKSRANYKKNKKEENQNYTYHAFVAKSNQMGSRFRRQALRNSQSI